MVTFEELHEQIDNIFFNLTDRLPTVLHNIVDTIEVLHLEDPDPEPEPGDIRVKTNRDFGILPNTGQDVTQAINDAAKSFDRKAGELQFEPGVYIVTQILLQPYLRWRGFGTGSYPHHTGTIFFQREGVNQSCFLPDPDQFPPTGGNAWMHGVEMAYMVITKEIINNTPQDTIGHGIDLKAKLGELTSFHHLRILNFPQSGLNVQRGGKPGYGIRDISSFGNGEYGVSVTKDGGFPMSAGALEGISTDRNGIAGIRVANFGPDNNAMFIRDVACESRVPTVGEAAVASRTQPYSLEIENVHCEINVQNMTTHSKLDENGDPVVKALFRMVGNNPGRLTAQNINTDTGLVMLRDENPNLTFPVDQTIQQWMYKDDMMRWALGDQGLMPYVALNTLPAPPAIIGVET